MKIIKSVVEIKISRMERLNTFLSHCSDFLKYLRNLYIMFLKEVTEMWEVN
jgi:hypothetical protein